MRNKLKTCHHVLTNGEVCNAIPMRDSNFCYWHHKARARRRRYERIGGPISMEANSGLELPFLEDANAVQVTIQEIMQAILDRRIDNKRAGLLLYSLQLASSNIRNLTPLPADGARSSKWAAMIRKYSTIASEPMTAMTSAKTIAATVPNPTAKVAPTNPAMTQSPKSHLPPLTPARARDRKLELSFCSSEESQQRLAGC